ncbi:MAG: GNAT family N-acetyltransferase [Candidatus Bathyarchaeia archaeon]
MGFRIRTRETEEDELFFERLNFESFRLTMLRGQDISEEEARERFIEFERSDLLDPWGPDHQVFFAEDDEGNLAGLIWLARSEPFYVFKEGLVWIYNLHVVPEYRRSGLARQLLAKAEEWTRQQGLNSIGLHVVDFNTAARCLYESSGYRLVATHYESCFYEKTIL